VEVVKISKLVIVTAEHHPYHKLWLKIADRLSKILSAPLDVKIEDYVYLVEHGDKDEFGMTWLPQILVEMDNGSVYGLLSQLPLDEKLEPSEEKAIDIMLQKLREIGVEVPSQL
jgi:hypothetical protein